MSDHVNHPAHYGGGGDQYEAIKVIEAWGLDFCLGNVLKYICRSRFKDECSEERQRDLRKAAWYMGRSVERHAWVEGEEPTE